MLQKIKSNVVIFTCALCPGTTKPISAATLASTTMVDLLAQPQQQSPRFYNTTSGRYQNPVYNSIYRCPNLSPICFVSSNPIPSNVANIQTLPRNWLKLGLTTSFNELSSDFAFVNSCSAISLIAEALNMPFQI